MSVHILPLKVARYKWGGPPLTTHAHVATQKVGCGSMLSKKGVEEPAGESAMMGRQDRDQRQLFYEFSLDEIIPP
jgi:hypothetical protein